MDRYSFIKQTKEKAAEDVKDCILEAVRALENSGYLRNYPKSEIPKVIQIAGAFHETAMKEATPGLNLPLRPVDIVNSENIADLVFPDVKKIRKELFSDKWPEYPPFGSFEDSAKWLVAEAKKGPKMAVLRVVVDGEKSASIQKSADRVFSKQAKSFSLDVLAVKEFRWEILSYFNEDGTVGRVFVSPLLSGPQEPTTLAKLKRGVETLIKYTGWTEQQAVGKILTGATPQIPAISLTTHESRNVLTGASSWVQLEIRGRDITYDELWNVYCSIRGSLGLRRKKSVTEKDILLLNLLKARAPVVWHNGIINGYKTLQKEWNKAHPGYKYKDINGYEGIRKAIERLSKKIQVNHYLPKSNKAVEGGDS